MADDVSGHYPYHDIAVHNPECPAQAAAVRSFELPSESVEYAIPFAEKMHSWFVLKNGDRSSWCSSPASVSRRMEM